MNQKSARISLRSRALATLLPLLLVASGGCDIAMADHSEKATAEWRKTYELQPGGRFEIGNVNGKVEVLPGTGNTVEVVATKTGSASTQEAAKEALQRIQIAESVSAGEVKIETKVDRSNDWGRRGTSVDYVVRVPANIDVKAITVNGGVEVTGVAGKVVAEATNGGVRGRDISGPIEATTTNGGVDIEITKMPEGGLTLECTNGGIQLRLPADAKASITARVTNGGIDTGGLALQTTGEASSRRLNGDLNGGGPRISLQGTNGGIKISAR
jgi:hypothetical protein